MSDFDDAPPEDPYQPGAPEPDTATMIEQRVIGQAMRYPHSIPKLQRAVSASDFQDLRLGAIFTGLTELHAQGAPCDYLAVWDRLAAWDVRGIGIRDLSTWADFAYADNGDYYAELVRAESMRRIMADIGSRLREPGADVGVQLARAVEDLRQVRDMAATSQEGVVWLKDLLDVPADEDAYDWVIPGLLERGDRLMLSASEGAGKTVMLRQLAVLSAAGVHPFQFAPIEPVQVLVVDAENSARQWRRSSRQLVLNAAERGLRDPRTHLAVRNEPVMDITRAADIGRIHRWMDEVNPDLLVLGPLYRMTGGSLNSDDDVAPVLAALDSLRERGVAMLIEVHAGHARASSGERELRPRGSSALLGWPEFGLGLRRDKVVENRRPTYSLVRWRGDRDRRDWPEKLTRGDHQVWPWEVSY